ncbi:MAG: YjzC family protein [Firmicutes bacterium]|nr:YjzC family protein [Bacillota bacterium]
MLHKTGEKAPSTGDYEFVMHLDGTTNCTSDERRIHLEKGETFPPHKSCEKACYWRLAE